MKINCPKCAKEFNLNESLAGKKAKCNACDEIFVIEFKKQVETVEQETFFEKDNKEEIKEEVKSEEPKKNFYQNKEENYQKQVFQDIFLKPKKISYFLFGNGFLLFFIILAFIVFITGKINPFFDVTLIVFLTINLIIFLFMYFSYKKENYTFKNDKIIYNYGSIFSDNNIEININKITQVLCNKPFLENKIFNTGKLLIKTAGSTTGFIYLKSVENPEFLYEEIQKRMQSNGFSIKKEHLVQEARPHMIGVLGESLNGVIANIVVLFYFGIGFLGEITKDKSVDQLYSELDNITKIGYSIIFGLVFFIFLLRTILRYFDYSKRVYQVYDDSVFYSEGFLTKNYAFLPMETVSDTENSQSFFSRILGIHDVIVSSEGSNNKVLFFNVINGKKMMENIKYLKENISIKNKEKLFVSKNQDNSSNEVEIEIKQERSYNKEFLATFKPNLLKTFFSNLVLMITIVGIPTAIVNIIRSLFMTFKVSSTNIEYKYDFITTKQNIFSVDKITQIVFIESILDKLLGTCSIGFFSIGSSNVLRFTNIKKTPELFENILSKVGIYKDIESENNILPISTSFIDIFKSNILFHIAFIFISIPTLFIPYILYIVFLKFYFYSKKYYKNTIYKDFVESMYGIIVQTKKYSSLENIKAIESIKYPLTSTGSIYLDVSGDSKQQYGKKATQYIMLSNTIKIPMVKELDIIFERLNIILNKKELDKNVIITSSEYLGNTLIWALVLFLPTFVLYPFIIGGIIWYFKTKKYVLEQSSVLIYEGIIYKTKKSILYKKIDFIEQNEGFINKIFKNGNISIFTKGSGFSDMTLKNTQAKKEIYELLRLKVK